jgi:hypothetical protein
MDFHNRIMSCPVVAWLLREHAGQCEQGSHLGKVKVLQTEQLLRRGSGKIFYQRTCGLQDSTMSGRVAGLDRHV